jgi:hypothetical protein
MTAPVEDRLSLLADRHLKKGGGSEADGTPCVMQAGAYMLVVSTGRAGPSA